MAKTKDASKMTSEELAQARNEYTLKEIDEIVEYMDFFKSVVSDESRTQNYLPREALAVETFISNIHKQLSAIEFFLTTRR